MPSDLGSRIALFTLDAERLADALQDSGRIGAMLVAGTIRAAVYRLRDWERVQHRQASEARL